MFPKRPGMPSTPPRPKPRKPRLEVQPQVYKSLQNGVDLLANALRPTLGPLPRMVAIQRSFGSEGPEILDDGGTIARRIIQVKDRRDDVGAMLLRHFAWRMNKSVGDGSVTMAVMFQRILDEGIHHILISGGSPMLLRQALEHYSEVVCDALKSQAFKLEEATEIKKIAKNLCRDEDIANLLSEVFDMIGKEGMIEIREGNRLASEREYVEGTFWDASGWFSANFQTDIENHRSLMEDPAILISDFSLKNAGEVVPLLEKAVKANIKNLVWVGFKMPDDVMSLFIRNSLSKTISVLPVRTPKIAEAERSVLLEDIAVMTGGRAFHEFAGESIDNVHIEDLGSAHLAWANDSYFGVIGGRGDSRRIRAYTNQLRESAKHLEGEAVEQMQKRVSRLVGGSAILKVGGYTESEIKVKKAEAERAVLAIRNAMSGGVVLGGGISLMACQAALETSSLSDNEEDKAARRILSRALEEPLRTIISNSGYRPDALVDKIKDSPNGFGFDALKGRIVDMHEAGIFDAHKVLDMAIRVAISGAAMALTTDIIIHRKLPPEIMEP